MSDSEPSKPAGYETTVEVVIYSPEPLEWGGFGTLSQIDNLISYEHAIGDWVMLPSRPVQTRDEMRKLLKAIGNSEGDFFEADWESDDEDARNDPVADQETLGLVPGDEAGSAAGERPD